MNLHQNSSAAHGSVPELFEIASTKLRPSVRQKSAVLEMRVLAADDRSLPVPSGARLDGRPASQVEIAKKTYQLERARQVDSLVDVTSDIYCIACKRLLADCACEKPDVDDEKVDSTAEESEKPDNRWRRAQRKAAARRRRLRRSMEGKVR